VARSRVAALDMKGFWLSILKLDDKNAASFLAYLDSPS